MGEAREASEISESVRVLSRGGPHLDGAAAYDDPELDALSVVGADIGMPLRPGHDSSTGARATAASSVRSSGWLVWRVALTGRWRDRVSVPVYSKRRGTPVAVLPRGRGAVVVEGSDRVTTRLDRTEAEGFAGEGLAFASPVPSEGGWRSLVEWGLRGQGWDLWSFFGLALLGGLAGLALPLSTAAIFQWAIPNGSLRLTLTLLVAFFVITAGAAVLALSRGRLIVRMRDRMDVRLGAGVMARLMRVRAPYFRRNGVGDVVNRAMSLSIARSQVSDTVIATVVMSAFGLTSLLFLFTAGPLLGALTSLTVFSVLGLSILVQWNSRKVLRTLLERRSATDSIVLSLLTGLVSWRVAGAEPRALSLWAERQRASTLTMRRRLGLVSGSAVIESAGPTAVLAVFTFLVVVLPIGTLEPGASSAPGAFLALYTAVLQVTIAMLALSVNLMALSEYGPVLDRLAPIRTAPVEGPEQGPDPGPLRGRVALDRVTFGYVEGRPPLFEDLSLEVEPGEFVAVVGPSGSGKSTVLRLLLGFEEPWTGFVSYDRRDLAGLDASGVRRQLGVVLQTSQPLGTTLRECVCEGRDLDDARVWDLLEHAGLADDVRAMPDGLATRVGDQGASLSGGQRQRLMIAAALSGDPRILLFDEATSALDNVSQSVVMRTILGSEATRIVIAHRLSTVERADRVVVIADGRVAEQGPPAVLLRQDGLFAKLAARQLS